jgi:histidine ammonia-lyase
MGVTSGLKAREIVRNVQTVLSIELICAAAGIEYRRPLRTSRPLEAVHSLIRSEVPHLTGDRVLYPDIRCATEMVRDGRIRAAAREAARA